MPPNSAGIETVFDNFPLSFVHFTFSCRPLSINLH